MKALNRITALTQKIKSLQERLKDQNLTPRNRYNTRVAIVGKKRTLRHLCKLYLWGVAK